MDEVHIAVQSLVKGGALIESVDEDGLVRYEADPEKDGANLKMDGIPAMQQKLDDDSRYADDTHETMRRALTAEALERYNPDNGTYFESNGDYAGSSTRIWEIDPKDWPELYSKVVKSVDKVLHTYLKNLKQRESTETTFSYFGVLGLHPKGGLKQWGAAVLAGLALAWGASNMSRADGDMVTAAARISHGTELLALDPTTTLHRSHGTQRELSHGTQRELSHGTQRELSHGTQRELSHETRF